MAENLTAGVDGDGYLEECDFETRYHPYCEIEVDEENEFVEVFMEGNEDVVTRIGFAALLQLGFVRPVSSACK